jgi:1,2-diacylglycerol-3-alpha-glucose alpha-1,2-glucosyltransferase
MKICLYPSIIQPMKMGGMKTAYEHKKQAFNLHHLDYSSHPLKGYFDILHLECPVPQSAFYAIWAKKKKKKIVISTHVTVEDFIETYSFGKKVSSFLRRYLSWYYSLADLLIAPSEYTKNLIKNYGVNKPIEVVSNGVDPFFLNDFQKKNNKIDSPQVIGSVGYVTKRKGVITFCTVAKAFPTYQFKWAGAIHDRLLFNVKSIDKPNNVEFLGFVEDIKKTYHSFDVFLFPSFEENQGIAILEAASFGIPLIIRDLPVYNGWLVHEENCLKCKNDADFINHLNVITNDKKLRENIGKNARKLAEKNNLKLIGKQLISLYEKMLNQ